MIASIEVAPSPALDRDGITIYQGDCREVLDALPECSVQTCVTSPPYWGLRDYGHDDQIGLEESPEEYVQTMVDVFRSVWRVLKKDGTLWVNLGDSYAGSWGALGRPQGKGDMSGRSVASARQIGAHPRFTARTGTRGKESGLKPKDLVGIPWKVAFALQADGWTLRQDIIWSKPSPMPESVKDRCTKSHEYIFLLTKSSRCSARSVSYCRHASAPRRQLALGSHRGRSNTAGMDNKVYDTRNKRSVWTVRPRPFKGAHFAVYPPELIQPCIEAGCPEGGVVLDPFTGSGTTAWVAQRFGRKFVGCELNPEYISLIAKRFQQRRLF